MRLAACLCALGAAHAFVSTRTPLRLRVPVRSRVPLGSEPDLRARLEASFQAPAAEGAEHSHQLDNASEYGTGVHASPPSWLIEDLPLWRVQWVALPGFLQLYHVHVPHYCHMFEQLVTMADTDSGSTEASGRFGHILLPGGSSSLGTDAARLAFDGTSAPVVGALMQVLQMERMSDGRLALMARAVGRFRVARETQSLPYTKADVVILPDEEEMMMRMPQATQIANTVLRQLQPDTMMSDGEAKDGGGGEGDMSRPNGWQPNASALGQIGASAPLASAAAEVAITRAAARAAAAAAALQWAFSEDHADVIEGQNDELAPLSMELDTSAIIAAADAAASEAANHVCRLGVASDMPPYVVALEGLPERRVDPQMPMSDKGREEDRNMHGMVDVSNERMARNIGGIMPSQASLLALEHAVWADLLTCLRLTRAARGLPPTPPLLPEAMLAMLPPPPAGGWPAEIAKFLPETPPMESYPPLRRAQRISYATAALLPELDRYELLRAPSVRLRLTRVLELLLEAKTRLAAIVAIRQADEGETR